MAIILVAFLLSCSLWWLLKDRIPRHKRNRLTAPEAGGSWPLIGHLPLLRGTKPLHIVLGELADKNGPVFTIKIGVHRALVVSNWENAKECFSTNDLSFASRPKTLATEILGYDESMFGFLPYGPLWRQLRKIATLELLSRHRLESFKGVRESEIRTSLKELYKQWETKRNTCNKVEVEMKNWFDNITLNLIFKIIVGKSVGYITSRDGGKDEAWKKSVREFFDLSGRFVMADAVPFLRWLDLGGHEKAMRTTAEELDAIVGEWLEEHKEKREARKEAGEGDFMGIMLDTLQDSEVVLDGRDPDTINRATCVSLLLAASDTTSITLTWALSLMLNHRDVLKKVQQEIDTHVGKERRVQESDVKNLVYLNAVVKETLRLCPPGAISFPHESMEDCTISGYHVPARTRLLTNLWKIQRDPRIWSDPNQFKPERFLTSHKDVDLKGQSFEFMPFGSGRRMCPGVNFALHVLHLSLATLLHGFDFETASGGLVDMTESIGLTNMKATPLDVLIAPRLPSHLYK